MGGMGRRLRVVAGVGLVAWYCLAVGHRAWGQIDFEGEPFRYHTAETDNPIARLQRGLESGEVALEYEPGTGYLRSLLKALQIDTASQTLVFSKTSFQFRKISPDNPRALYFNDDTYIGWVPGGEVIEVSTVDPRLGAIFYTFPQARTEQPRFERDKGQCLTCHATSRTQGVPGHVVRSVYADATGQPVYQWGTFNTDDHSPFVERWGGWYVTGTHGAMRHMGNQTLTAGATPQSVDLDRGANRVQLNDQIDTSVYLEPTSDIVALMVLEHQAQMHNVLARAHYDVGMALHYNSIMNEALKRPADYQSESVERRIVAAAERVLKSLLFVGEFQLTSPVSGSSKFAERFAGRGAQVGGRGSLREFDLQQRLFRYPCSYLIDSPAFAQLPPAVYQRVIGDLRQVLSGENKSADFAGLSVEDRAALRELLGPKLTAVQPAASDLAQ